LSAARVDFPSTAIFCRYLTGVKVALRDPGQYGISRTEKCIGTGGNPPCRLVPVSG